MYIKSDKETIKEVGFIIPFHFIHLHGPVKLVYKIKVVSLNPAHGEQYFIQHNVIKFVSDLRQVRGFLQFPPPIKPPTTI
jgi:hypothetical protein